MIFKNYKLDIDRENLKLQIESLPEINKAVAVLYFFDKKSCDDIAEELSISISVTNHRLAKAVFLIRKATGYAPYQRALQILYGNSLKNRSNRNLFQ